MAGKKHNIAKSNRRARKFTHRSPQLFEYNSDPEVTTKSIKSSLLKTLKKISLPKVLKPYLPAFRSGDIICGQVFIECANGKYGNAIKTTNGIVANSKNFKTSWSRVFVRVDTTIALIACYMSEDSKRAIDVIELKDSKIILLGKSSENSKIFVSWKVVDKYGTTYTLATPHKDITRIWYEAMRFLTCEVCKAERNKLFAKREAKKNQMEEVFDKLKAPSPDNESIRLQNLIEAATAGDLEAVRKFLRPTSSKNLEPMVYSSPGIAKAERSLCKFDSLEMKPRNIWEEEVGTIENIKIEKGGTTKDILRQYGYAVGHDCCKGQLIGVKLTSLDYRSAQIIQSCVRGMLTRSQYMKKFAKGPKVRFVKRLIKQKQINKLRRFYNENPLELRELRLKKRKKKENTSPYDRYSDHLQRLMAFAPHRTENMVRLIQTTYRGYQSRKVFRDAIVQVRKNAAAIQGWYRTTVNLYWRLRHNKATVIEKYERRRQAYIMLKTLRLEAEAFILEIVDDVLFDGTMLLVRAHILIRWLRMKIFRMRFLKLKDAVTKVSAWWRKHKCMSRYSLIRKYIILTQACYRRMRLYREFQIKFKSIRNAVLTIQGWWRAGTLPYVFQRKRLSVTLISAWYRCYHQQRKYCKTLRVICKVQGFYRRNVAYVEYTKQQNAVSVIAAAARRRHARLAYRRSRQSVLILQMRIRIMLAKKILRKRKLHFSMIILAQKNARRFLQSKKYDKMLYSAKHIQRWWRGLVFQADANSHMCKIRTAATIIQKIARKYLVLSSQIEWRKKQCNKVMLWTKNGNEPIYHKQYTTLEGKILLINISAKQTGLVVKIVDLSGGHKKTWDVEVNLVWQSLLMLVLLHPKLNCNALSTESFLNRLTCILCDRSHEKKLRRPFQPLTKKGDCGKFYLHEFSSVSSPVRIPVRLQKSISALYDRQISKFFMNNTCNQRKSETDHIVTLYNPIRSDIYGFQEAISTFSDAYDVVSESFLNAVRRNLSNEGKFYLERRKDIIALLVSPKGIEKIRKYMDTLKVELLKVKIFRNDIMEKMSSTPDQFCYFTDEKNDIRGTLLQSLSPQILLSVMQGSLRNFDISTRRQDTQRINFRFRASNYIEWSLLVEFAQYCIKHLGSNDENETHYFPDWFQTLKHSLLREITTILPNINLTATVYAKFIKQCDKNHPITSLLPAFAAAIDILAQDWYHGFRRSTENVDEILREAKNDAYHGSKDPDIDHIIDVLSEEYIGKWYEISSLRNNNLSKDMLSVKSLDNQFHCHDFDDCIKSLKIFYNTSTHYMLDVNDCKERIDNESSKHDLCKSFDADFELQPLLEKSTKLLTFLQGLRKMDVILHAGKIQNDKCHQVLTQAKKQQFEQEKNVKYWKMKDKQSRPNLKLELEVLRRKKDFIVGKESRPDEVDLATFKYHEALISIKEKEVQLCQDQLETVRSACLNMESDVKYAKAELEHLSLFNKTQEDWKNVLAVFSGAISKSISDCNTKVSAQNFKLQQATSVLRGLEQQRFAYAMTREMHKCDLISLKVGQLRQESKIIKSKLRTIVRQLSNYLVRMSVMIMNLVNTYTVWCIQEVEACIIRKEIMDKAILMMNSTTDRLNTAEKLLDVEIQKSNKFVAHFKREITETMQLPKNYWWFTYSRDIKNITVWHKERKKDRYRKYIEHLKIKEEALLALRDDDSSSSVNSKDGSESEGSALDYDSDAFETASDSSDADDDESRDSYDFRFEDLEDLSFETIFMPLKQRREVLLAKRMGEKKTKVKKAVKLWNDTRRKTILRKVRQRTVQHCWEKLHFQFKELEKGTLRLANEVETAAPLFSRSFEGVAIHSVLKHMNIMVAHADWQDIDEISARCDDIISKLDQAYNLLDPIFHKINIEKNSVGKATDESSGKTSNIPLNETGKELLLCPKTDLNLNLLADIVDVQSKIKEFRSTVDFILKQHEENNIQKETKLQMDGINHKKYSRADFFMYKEAFMKYAERKDIKGIPRYFISAQRLASACEMCGRISVDWSLIPLQIERIYGKTEIEFNDFLDYVNRPLEDSIEIKAKYYKYIANEVVNYVSEPVSHRISGLLDKWSPVRRRRIKEVKAATTLQAWFRMAILRRVYRMNQIPLKQTLKVSKAALVIQNAFWKYIGHQHILKKYIMKTFDKVADAETEQIIYVNKETKHSILNLPSFVDQIFVKQMEFSKDKLYQDQRVVNAIRPEQLNEDSVQILKLKQQLKTAYIKGVEKAKRAAERMMVHKGIYELPCDLIEVPRGLNMLIESINDRKRLEELVAAFGLTSNGLKKALAAWLEIKPENYDENDGIVL